MINSKIVSLQEGYTLSKNARNLFINRNNRALLIYSQYAKQNAQSLYKLAYTYLDSPSNEIDKGFNYFTKDEIILFNDTLANVINQCRDEWIGDVNPYEIIEDEKKRKKCTLCKQKNKLIFHIKNQFNGMKMNVGSKCITAFHSLEYPSGLTKAEVMRRAHRQSRIQSLTLKFPGIEKIVSSWESELEKYHVLIPEFLENKYLDIGSELKEIYNNYLKRRVGKADIKKISKLLKSRDSFLSNMRDYETENKLKDYVVTRKIVKWLQLKNDYETIKHIKKTGYVTSDIVHKILEPNFLESLIPKINRLFEKQGISVIAYEKEYVNYKIKPFSNLEFYLKVNSRILLKNFGPLLFRKAIPIAPSLQNIFKISHLYSENEQNMVLNELNRMDSVIGTELLDYGYAYDHFERNELDLFDKRIKRFIVVNLSKFLEEFKGVAFELGKIASIEQYVDYLLKENTKTYTYLDLRGIRDRTDNDIDNKE
ncbi:MULTISPECIES: hypothetical protein [Bacillus]|uniref:Uncharacterized protein n=3 Tax=Bacillus cereus group TaxID=86661 RepID=A0A6I6YVR5_9BACI|nr:MULTISPECIES: hypothetical protein [Bacillus]KMQ26965.1 hypothetical protein TU53_28050 [Bacillus cereus]KXX95044.1 hypothetical protein AT277_09260 [Bacillus cereus]KXY91471.1 hypothetical protein AT276_19170 [Bacillus cereus]MBL3795001.1 hypothetical protein [Bacillus cereus]MBL3856410.1 hypothetical protein [Bacillus cereus]